jgi:glycosyltransferase involved in cell wall biosynthesis
MSHRLSVITINYNDANGLKKTIESVSKQTFKGYEYIIIDGGSSDESVTIIKEQETFFIKRGIPYKWICENDKGIYDAMNKGIVKAEGDYCFFLNSGDYFTASNILEMVFSGIPDEDFVFGNLVVCLNEKVVGMIKGKTVLTFMDLYRSDVVKHQSTFIKRSMFSKYGLYNIERKIVADWEFFLRSLGLSEPSYKYLDIDIAFFDNNGLSNNSGNITSRERESVLMENLPQKILADYKRYEKYTLLEPAFRYTIFRVILKIVGKFARRYEKLTKRV